LRSFAAPPIVPVTITARITSTCRSVIIGPKLLPPLQRGVDATGEADRPNTM
jgi:hypothetical protein